MQSVIGNEISIEEIAGPELARTYRIRFFGTEIFTTVTSSERLIKSWIERAYESFRESPEFRIVGFAVKCNLLNVPDLLHASVLQQSVGHNCLIVRLNQLVEIPRILLDFINDENSLLVGRDNRYDGVYLQRCNPLFRVREPRDVRYKLIEMRGLEIPLELATMEFMMCDVYHYPEFRVHRGVLVDDWNDVEQLSREQVLYASVEVYLSGLIGRDVFANLL